MNFELTVNGEKRTLDVDPEMPLLWVLRDVLQLTGTKFGCGQSLCGACTIHLNGTAIRSCVTPVAAAQNQAITTIEGLATDASHPLQKKWVELGVPQCGYCQPGQIMQAAALLKGKKKPTGDDIDSAMNGNLCRCGTYMRIREAIKQVAGVSKTKGRNV